MDLQGRRLIRQAYASQHANASDRPLWQTKLLVIGFDDILLKCLASAGIVRSTDATAGGEMRGIT